MFSLNSFSGTVSGYFLLWIIKTKQKSINLAFQFASFKEAIIVYEKEECNLRILHSRPEKKRFINNIPVIFTWFRFNSIFWTTTFEKKLHPVTFVFWGRVRSCWKWNSNRSFYSYELSTLASEWKWGWYWPCFDTNLFSFVMKIMLKKILFSIRRTWFTQ